MASIKKKPPPIQVVLPDFRNLGFMLRTLIIANLLGLAAAISRSESPAGMWQELLAISALLQPMLLASILALYALGPLIGRLSYRLGVLAVLAVELVVATLVWVFTSPLFGADSMSGLSRWWLLTVKTHTSVATGTAGAHPAVLSF